jgi:hypothetical protein
MSTLRIKSLTLFLVAPAIALGACGGQQSDAKSRDLSAEFAHGTIGACLVDAGAIRADSSKELQFLENAESEDEVQEPGFAYDRKAKIIVSIVEQSPGAGSTAQWTVWVAQPFGKSFSPAAIVDSNPPHSYVMFINNVSHKVSSEVEKCITFR